MKCARRVSLLPPHLQERIASDMQSDMRLVPIRIWISSSRRLSAVLQCWGSYFLCLMLRRWFRLCDYLTEGHFNFFWTDGNGVDREVMQVVGGELGYQWMALRLFVGHACQSYWCSLAIAVGGSYVSVSGRCLSYVVKFNKRAYCLRRLSWIMKLAHIWTNKNSILEYR